MGADMMLRSIYLRHGQPFDLDAANHAGRTLIDQATNDHLAHLERADYPDDPRQVDEPLDEQPPAGLSVGERRERAYRLTTGKLTEFAESLTSRDVFMSTLGLVDCYATGGRSWGDSPTGAWEAWDLFFDPDALPGRWGDVIAAAGGLLHPYGSGPIVATIPVRAWTA